MTQTDLFADHAPAAPIQPDPANVRRKLGRVLAEAKAADAMPWDERKAAMWRTVFPNMANWLPEGERARIRAEWAVEMERLAG